MGLNMVELVQVGPWPYLFDGTEKPIEHLANNRDPSGLLETNGVSTTHNWGEVALGAFIIHNVGFIWFVPIFQY